MNFPSLRRLHYSPEGWNAEFKLVQHALKCHACTGMHTLNRYTNNAVCAFRTLPVRKMFSSFIKNWFVVFLIYSRISDFVLYGLYVSFIYQESRTSSYMGCMFF